MLRPWSANSKASVVSTVGIKHKCVAQFGRSTSEITGSLYAVQLQMKTSVGHQISSSCIKTTLISWVARIVLLANSEEEFQQRMIAARLRTTRRSRTAALR